MKRDTLLAEIFFFGLKKFKSLPLLASVFHRRLESLYFRRLFRDTRSNQFLNNYPLKLPQNFSPVFVLSTGRCGTLTLTTLMSLSPSIQAYHEPYPRFVSTSYFYYYRLGPNHSEKFWHELINFARGELMLRAYWLDRVYFESNNRITLLADLFNSIFPHAKFIHLVRHPYYFVRSAMHRGYYKDHIRDYARISPQPTNEIYDKWNNISRMEKCAWLYKQTNQHILKVLEKVPNNRKEFLRAEDVFSFKYSEIYKIFKFVNINSASPNAIRINKILKKRLNPSIKQFIPDPEYWSKDELYTVNKHTLSLMEKFRYEA
jgi:hypothetical protein